MNTWINSLGNETAREKPWEKAPLAKRGRLAPVYMKCSRIGLESKRPLVNQFWIRKHHCDVLEVEGCNFILLLFIYSHSLKSIKLKLCIVQITNQKRFPAPQYNVLERDKID